MEWRRMIHIFVVAFVYYFLFSPISIYGALVTFITKVGIVGTFPISLFVTGLFEKNELDQAKVMVKNVSGIVRKKIGLSH